MKRIKNQNIQEKKLLQLLNDSITDSNNKLNLDNSNNKNLFDNEKIDNSNDIIRSPFFKIKVSNSHKEKCSTDNNKTDLMNNDTKDKISNNKIMGFIQINNEINPFNIKDNDVNFFDKDIKKRLSVNKLLLLPEVQQNSSDEILSFRKKDDNSAKIPNIVKNYSIMTADNKINIDMKYVNNVFYKNNSNKADYNKHLIVYNFHFEFLIHKIKVRRISARLKESRLIKENDEIIMRQNNINNNYLYNLSTIKEEESPFMQTYRKMDNYYTISNNSKLFSKTSIENLIDGEKEINEEDIDKILFDSFSEYNQNKIRQKMRKNKSQELIVISNFNSAMRNRKNRKENAKLIIKGLLCLIRFFSILCFKIRKAEYMKFKLNWKLKKFIHHLIIFCFKRYFLKSKNKLDMFQKC
jgi:hypothetical protein